jgi:hypothetical protein
VQMAPSTLNSQVSHEQQLVRVSQKWVDCHYCFAYYD